MGDFESLKMTVGLSRESEGDPTVTLAKMRPWVEDNLGDALSEVVATIKGN